MIDLYKAANLNQLKPKHESDDELSGGRVSTETTPNHLDKDKMQTFPIDDNNFEERLLVSPNEHSDSKTRPSFEEVTGIN